MGAYQGKVLESEEEAREYIEELIQAHPVIVFTKVHCPYCYQAKWAFDGINVKYEDVVLTRRPDAPLIQDVLLKMTGARTVPRVFVNQKCIGGGYETSALKKEGKLKALVDGN
uniref:Glutaredoxin domain-containing protein n=1 Tax=Ciona savignyi TaxID=51511 RepID=H2ZLA3_CIOSA